ncbi:MAG: phosphopantothenoylcysteine decarboxylase [Elusimicrobiota bacterium]
MSLKGNKITVTAGPTREMWDSIRFLSNLSSGKTGYAIAEVANDMGGEVTLISGREKQPSEKAINYIYTFSARDMFEEVKKRIESTDIFISAAAVSDFRPVRYKGKISKKQETPSIELKRNPDILKSVAENFRGKLIVGFSLADKVNISEGRKKLEAKGCDIMVLNSTRNMGEDKKSFVLAEGKIEKEYEAVPVREMAEIILKKCQKKI